MQLTKIKIAGFKTFVDPTTILLPSKLVAVVGPNGCGKSNIIDAVTWVMGESSPKYLRGEALTDVIFNGSGSRKPVGQATVELVFDNADGSIGGEYSKFAEISVKRVINRDSDSTYYLNGVRCRKRDVVDIFLGTGLGPRSYSIIGQNMINRIIEAKPEELRTYLEEAAGISKYKERRHETELRISHTKENLARVMDLRGELEKQLSHLKYQANMAEKYKTLKQEERILRAQSYAIEWRQLDSRMVDYTLNIKREETALEARMSDISLKDRELEQMRHEKRTANDAFQEVQRRYYAVGNEITRIEQDILHHQERQQQWENDNKQTEQDYLAIKNQMSENEDDLRKLEQDLQTHKPQHAALENEVCDLEEKLVASEEEMQTWQTSWDELNQRISKTKQTMQVEKTRTQHLEERVLFLQKRQSQIQQDLTRINFTDLDKEINAFSQQSTDVAKQLSSEHSNLDMLKQEIAHLLKEESDAKVELDKIRSELQQLRGQQASLLALQQTALGQRDNPTAPWVSKHHLDKNTRLAQHIEVESGWELAVEKVLGFCLQAIRVNDVNEIISHLDDFHSGNLCAFTKSEAKKSSNQNLDQNSKGIALLQKIKSAWPLEAFISGIYIADTIDQALKLCEKLDDNESVITRDGVWLNRAWIKILREDDPAQGIFQREQALKELAINIKKFDSANHDIESKIAKHREQIELLEHKREQSQAVYNEQQARSVELSTQQKLKQERFSELRDQSSRLLTEQQECEKGLKDAEIELQQAKNHWQEADELSQQQEIERNKLVNERDKVRLALQTIRETTNDKKDQLHEIEIRQETTKSQKAALMQNMSHLQKQITILNERKILLEKELKSKQPLDAIKQSLTKALDNHVSIESELSVVRNAVAMLDQEFRDLEEKRQGYEHDMNKIRSRLETLRVELQGWKVKTETLVEQLQQTEFTLEDVLKNLPQSIDLDEWQAKLEQINQRINRMGAINLVAIEEYATCLERKEYLDKQLEDLQAGLNTLEEAIAKIDKETKARFKETFDKVNERFQELFPTVFGGGKAYLELTSDNLLEAGVSVMACPPGKRNSSIYLLSGGEKSLTAIALIFSIFHLNPAPFCLLDEVDAALDDANVLRFTHIVKSMVDNTQFIFISHNKISIEMGEHLIGVTMNEPGVSRLVTVDIEKAMSLAGVEGEGSSKAESSHA